MIELWNKYKEVIAYLFWGVLTTIIDIVVAIGCRYMFPEISAFWNTIIAWVASVLFAFFTNRRSVFHSHADNAKDYFKEMFSFIFGRLASLVLEEIVLVPGVMIFGNKNFNILKIIGQVIVIVFNYFWSKLIVFVNHNK